MASKYKVIAASVPTLIVLNIVLFAAVVVLAAFYVQERNRPAVQGPSQSAVVNLGVYDYEFEDGRAVRVSSENLDNLRDLLTEKAEKSAASGCSAAVYSVDAMNEDRNQALLKYGCNSPDSPMHAKHVDGEWQAISPTNKFNNFRVPLCEYVDEHDLDSEVAPVCFEVVDGSAVYTAR